MAPNASRKTGIILACQGAYACVTVPLSHAKPGKSNAEEKRQRSFVFLFFTSSRLRLTPFMPAFRNKTNTKAGFPKVYQCNWLEKLEKILNSALHLFVFEQGKKTKSVHFSL